MNDQIKEEIVRLRENKKFNIITASQIILKDYGPEAWTMEKLIPEQSITAIAGAPGSWKTWLTLEIARCVSSGEDFLGKFKTTQGSVLFIDKENHTRHIQKRLRQIGITGDHPIYYLDQKEQDFFVEKDEKFTGLRGAVKNLSIKLVVFDSLVRIHSGDENDAKSIAIVMNRFRQITNLGASVIFVHHHRKEPVRSRKTGNSLRGSSDILAGVDCLLIVEKAEDEGRLTIDQAKLRQGPLMEPFAIAIQADGDEGAIRFSHAGSHNPKKALIEEMKAAIPEILKEKGAMGKQQLAESLPEEYSPAILTKAIKELVEGKTINQEVGAHNKQIYSSMKTTGEDNSG